MNKFILLFCCLICSLFSDAQIVSTPHGVIITVDSVTTELCVLSPTTVRIVKYVNNMSKLSKLPKLDLDGAKSLADSLPRKEAAGKLKIDTGRFYAAVNAKDGNVSFWSHDDKLILAEQHRTARFKCVNNRKQSYNIAQDFQFGKSGVDSIFCPVSCADKRVNLKGKKTRLGDKSAGAPKRHIATNRGYSIFWNTSGEAYINDEEDRPDKKPGDVTFLSSASPAMDYVFVYGLK